MKVNIEIDCTPDEARGFMGLPDVRPLHDLYLERMQALIKDGIGAADVEKLMAAWLPSATLGLEQMQKAWGAMAGGMMPKSK